MLWLVSSQTSLKSQRPKEIKALGLGTIKLGRVYKKQTLLLNMTESGFGELNRDFVQMTLPTGIQEHLCADSPHWKVVTGHLGSLGWVPALLKAQQMPHFCPVWSFSQWVAYPVCPIYYILIYCQSMLTGPRLRHWLITTSRFRCHLKNISPSHPPPSNVTMNRKLNCIKSTSF